MPTRYQEIGDSEDEDALLSPISKADHRVATASRGEVVPAELELTVPAADGHHHEPSAVNSTGSTDEQLRQAHLDLMAPTQDVPTCIQVAPASSGSASLNHPKRRLTGSDATPPSSSARGKLKRIKTSPSLSSRPSNNDTIPGDTNPYLEHAATNDTIPGQSIPIIESGAQQRDQFSPSRVRRNASQQATPSENISSSLTPWSVSAVGNSSAIGPTAHENSSGVDQTAHNDSNRLDKTAHDKDNEAFPVSDDYLAGLPKEHYNPRPSRSRSERIILEAPLNFSKCPEKSSKAKRAKTIAHSPVKPNSQEDHSGPRIFPEHPILQAPMYEPLSPPLPGTGISDPTLVNSLPLLDEGLPQTIPETTASEAASLKPLTKKAERAAKAAAAKAAKALKPPGKRGRPRKNPIADIVVDEEDELAYETPLDDEASKVQHKKSGSKSDVQVVITPRDPISDSAGTLNGEQPHDVKSILNALNEKFPLKPLTSAPLNSVETEGTVVEDKEDTPGIEYDENNQVNAAKNTKANVKNPKAQAAKAFKLPSVSTSSDTMAPKTKADVVPDHDKEAFTKDRSPTVHDKTTMAKSSPTMGRGPIYRVGLSKTQRTQSLLKVFRK